MAICLSVIIAAHNPDIDRLRRVLVGLCRQTLRAAEWETIIIDNGSLDFPTQSFFVEHAPNENLTVLAESQLGLSSARRRGFHAARGEFAVLVDDDNVLAPDYLETVLTSFTVHPRVGALGGKSVPEFASKPPPWTREFFGLLALRDLGDEPLFSQGPRPAGSVRNEYPACAPIGAGMALRRAAWTAWLDARRDDPTVLSDRRGGALTSSGDNDLVFCALRAGLEVAYFPELVLNHLIPAGRLEPDYLARLNRGIQQSWMQMLSLHDANPWPPLSPVGAWLRKLKAGLVHQPWRSPAARVRWAGACGHFDGRVRP